MDGSELPTFILVIHETFSCKISDPNSICMQPDNSSAMVALKNSMCPLRKLKAKAICWCLIWVHSNVLQHGLEQGVHSQNVWRARHKEVTGLSHAVCEPFQPGLSDVLLKAFPGIWFSSSLCLLCMLIQRQLFHATPLSQTKSRQRITRESVARIYGIILWPFSNYTATLPPLGHFFNAASAH